VIETAWHLIEECPELACWRRRLDKSDIITKILKLSKAAPLVAMLAGRSEELQEQELDGESSP